MKSNSRFLWQLNGIVRVLFWLGLAFAALILYDEIKFGDNNPDRTYPIHVNVSLTKPSTRENVTQQDLFTDNERYAAISAKTLSLSSTEGTMYVMPKSTFATFLILLQIISLPIAWFVVLRLLNLFLARLETNFSFNHALSKYVKYMGNTLIIYQCIAFVTDKLIAANFAQMQYIPQISGCKPTALMEITPGSSTSFVVFFVGVLLLVVARLINHGYDLQQETELTI